LLVRRAILGSRHCPDRGAIKEIGDLLFEGVESAFGATTGLPKEEVDAYEKEAENVFTAVSMMPLDVPVLGQQSSQKADKSIPLGQADEDHREHPGGSR
jgi:hypothetical protein